MNRDSQLIASYMRYCCLSSLVAHMQQHFGEIKTEAYPLPYVRLHYPVKYDAW